MKIFADPGVEVTYRAFSLAPGKYSLSVALLVPFKLRPEGQANSSPDQSVWDIIKPAVKGYSVFDEGWPKLQGEYLVFGSGYMRANERQPVSVAVTVGSLKKQLAVFGDRFFSAGGAISHPIPFLGIPISPQTAYGGQSCEDNPYGKGAEPIKNEEGSLLHPLPNVEMPNAMMTSPTSQPPVSGFWPYYPDMPQRTQYLGAFDSQWVKSRWPHLPTLTDFSFFQVAPADQRLPTGFWQGKESVSVQNMHPDHPVLTGQIPAQRARLFGAVWDKQGERHIGEAKSRLETVLLMPEQLAGVALYRCVIEVDDPEARDVAALYAQLESLDDPPGAAQSYLTAFEEKLNQTGGDDPPTPVQGIPTPEEEKVRLEQLTQDLDAQRKRFLTHLSDAGMTEAQVLASLRRNPQTRELALIIEQTPGGVSGFFDQIERFATWAASEPDNANDASLAAAAESRLARQAVISRQLDNQDCRDLNLQGADLSGLDLSHVDFSGSVLIGASFVGAVLRGSKFDRAVLTDANFAAADLSGASFIMSSLNGVRFHGTNLSSAILLRADCALASFSDAVLDGLDMSSANLAGAELSNARLCGISAHKTDFTGANLARADFTNAKLLEANFSGCELTAALFSHASCIGTNFASAKLHKCSFVSADLTDSSADKGTQATAADFQGASLIRACWIGANLSGSNFDNAVAQDANFSQAVMSMVKARRVNGKQATFDRAVITDADFSKSNWMEASFAHTQMTNSILSHCNLFGANFLDTMFSNVQIENAYIARTILAARLDTPHV